MMAMNYKRSANSADRIIKRFGRGRKYDFVMYNDVADVAASWKTSSRVVVKLTVFAVFLDNQMYFNKKKGVNQISSVAYISPSTLPDDLVIQDECTISLNNIIFTVNQSEMLKPDGDTLVLLTLRLTKNV